jgi:DNA-binding transcriptional LysR family regulator
VLTQSGRDVLAVAEGIDGALQGLGRRVFGRDERIEGTIRVTLTSGVAKLIATDVAAFMAQHPRLIVEMNVTNSAEDLELMEADIAIRLTESPPETLVGRKLVDLNSALYAATGSAIDRSTEVPFIGTAGERTISPWARQVAAESALRREREPRRCVERTGRFRCRRR